METKPLLYKNPAGIAVSVKVADFAFMKSAIEAVRIELETERKLCDELDWRLKREHDSRCFDCGYVRTEQSRLQEPRDLSTTFHCRIKCSLSMCPHELKFKHDTLPDFDEFGNFRPYARGGVIPASDNPDRPENSLDAW